MLNYCIIYVVIFINLESFYIITLEGVTGDPNFNLKGRKIFILLF